MDTSNGAWKVFGHERAKNILEKQLATGKFPNAYLFAGSEGVGKKTLALEFAKKILGTENLENHPDFIILDQTEEISVESALAFISKLGFKPFVAKKKVAIINNAENLNTHSGNALLKTLEEPSDSTIIILISGQARLLPTIVSRCQIFRFNSFSISDLENFAKLNNLKSNNRAAELAFGKISRLKKLSEDSKYLAEEEMLATNYTSFSKIGIAEKLLAINKYAELETPVLEQNLLSWLNWQTGHMAEAPGNYKKLEALNESILGIKQNKNKKLLLQSLFLKL